MGYRYTQCDTCSTSNRDASSIPTLLSIMTKIQRPSSATCLGWARRMLRNRCRKMADIAEPIKDMHQFGQGSYPPVRISPGVGHEPCGRNAGSVDAPAASSRTFSTRCQVPPHSHCQALTPAFRVLSDHIEGAANPQLVPSLPSRGVEGSLVLPNQLHMRSGSNQGSMEPIKRNLVLKSV